MEWIRKRISILCVVIMALCAIGCNERVPPGYSGMVLTPSGLKGDVLAPGMHECYGRDKMLLFETKEQTYSETMSVLCADDLNFKFDLKVRARLQTSDKAVFKDVLRAQGSFIQYVDGKGDVLGFDTMYMNYIQPQARSISRGVVSKYATTDIRANRERIQGDIEKKLREAITGTPVEVTMVVTSNFDYPDVVEKAVEKKREREIAIGEEKAKQAMKLLEQENAQAIKLLEAENRLKIAQKLKLVRATEAEAEAAYVRIMGKSYTNQYLKMKDIEAKLALYTESKGAQFIVGEIPPLMLGK